MIIMPINLNILVKNIQKSFKALTNLLKEQANGPYHIIMIQEAPYLEIRKATHIDFPKGIPIIGLPINNSWTNIPPPNTSTLQVGIYVWSYIFNKFHFSMDHDLFHHNNILTLFITHPPTKTTVLYVNLYENPNRSSPAPQRGATLALLQNLYKLTNLFFICSNFNLHCSFWDKQCHENPQIAWDLINKLSNKGLSLVNDDSIPTFYQTHAQPQVNDLIWIHQDTYLNLTVDIEYNISKHQKDHQYLNIQFGNQTDMSHQFSQLPAEHRYIKADSDAEGDLILEVLQKTQS